MTLRVVGAGLGRTGTHSLKFALEKLLGGPCYHMAEVFPRPDHVNAWLAAANGTLPDWHALFAGFHAAVDWPMASYWEEIASAFPDAIILHSVRDAEAWWKSASTTIFPTIDAAPEPWRTMVRRVFATRFTPDIHDREAAIAAYEAHNERVRRLAPPARLVEWRAGDGWAPLCRALRIPVPDEPFPHVNTTEEFLGRLRRLEPAGST